MRRLALVALAALACAPGLTSAGCASSGPAAAEPAASPLPVRELPMEVWGELLPDVADGSRGPATAGGADGREPASAVRLSLLLRPLRGGDVRLRSAGVDRPVLIEIRARWQDFRGDGPVAVGRTAQILLPWTGEAEAAPDRAAEILMRIELAPAAGVLARRVSVEGSVIGLEVVGEAARSGGLRLRFQAEPLESLAARSGRSLAESLQSGDARSIFLAAAGSAPAGRPAATEALVEALPALDPAPREAAFAALLFLTGQTLGRDVHRWRTWWESTERHAAEAAAPSGAPSGSPPNGLRSRGESEALKP